MIDTDVDLSGELRFALLDENAPLLGFGFDDGLPIHSNGTSLRAEWENGMNLNALQCGQIRLGLRARHACRDLWRVDGFLLTLRRSLCPCSLS